MPTSTSDLKFGCDELRISLTIAFEDELKAVVFNMALSSLQLLRL